MRKHHNLFLVCAFLFLSGQAVAQGPTIFVSTFGANQILSVDGTTGATMVIHTGLFSFFPEDIVVGPDGNIYICDAPSNRIFRLNPNTFQIETIYDLAGASPPNNPSGPEGPSFINNDLVFNTRGGAFPHTGVWKIAGVATIPFTGTIPPPVNLIDATGTGSTFGEGTAFDEIGNLLVVDRSGNRILRVSAPSFAAPATVLIENPPTPAAPVLDTPFGVAVNSKNEIFVANGGSTFRNIQRFDSNGIFLGEFVHFRDDALDNPSFMEFDASDNLFVVTNQTPQALGGKVWRVDPAGSKTLLVDLSLELIDPDRDPMLASDRALGLAVPPTSTSITKFFIQGFPSQNYNFGTHSISITFDRFFDSDLFAVRVTAEDALPADVAVLIPGGTPCVQYASKGGFCVVYRVEPPFPIGGVNFDATNPAGGILIYIGYFTAGSDAGISGRIRGFSGFVVVDDPNPNIDPNLLHDPSGDASDDFSEDVTVEFFPQGLPVDDGDNFFCGFLQPFPDGSTLVKSGRTFPLRFKVSTSESCSSDFNPHVVAWLSVEKIANGISGSSELLIAESSGKANTDVFFRFDSGSGTYKYNLSLKGFSEGTYKLTVFSNVLPPQMVEFSVRK